MQSLKSQESNILSFDTKLKNVIRNVDCFNFLKFLFVNNHKFDEYAKFYQLPLAFTTELQNETIMMNPLRIDQSTLRAKLV